MEENMRRILLIVIYRKFVKKISNLNSMVENLKMRENESENLLSKYSSAILKMENEISKFKKEFEILTSEISVKKLENDKLINFVDILQKKLESDKHAGTSHVCKESELKVEILRIETEKNELYSQFKSLEYNLENQIQRETDLIKRFREKEMKIEDEKTQFSLQIQLRNKAVEEIMHLQALQQTEISSLQFKIEDSNKKGKNSEKEERFLKEKSQKETIEFEKQIILIEEKLKNELKNEVKNSENREKLLRHELDFEREKITKEIRSLEIENKKLVKENKDLLQEYDRMNTEIDNLEMIKESQFERFQNIEEKQMQKEKLWEQEIEYLKNELVKKKKKEDLELENKWKEESELKKIEIEAKKREIELKKLELDKKTIEIQNLKSKILLDQIEKEELVAKDAKTESKNEELKNLLKTKDNSEKTKIELLTLKQENQKLEEENFLFNNNLKKYKLKLKILLTKNDELKNENIFFETKIEKLEKKMMQMIYGDNNDSKTDEETDKLRSEIQSIFISFEKQK